VVHTNRVLQQLRTEGLVTPTGTEVHILGHRRMVELAGSDPTYLHLDPGH